MRSEDRKREKTLGCFLMKKYLNFLSNTMQKENKTNLEKEERAKQDKRKKRMAVKAGNMSARTLLWSLKFVCVTNFFTTKNRNLGWNRLFQRSHKQVQRPWYGISEGTRITWRNIARQKVRIKRWYYIEASIGRQSLAREPSQPFASFRDVR